MIADKTLMLKWRDRADEWRRLAVLADDPHVASVCDKMAEQADTMEKFWAN